MNIPKGVNFIINRLTDKGYQAVVCGGCIRDHLLGVAPKDYDIATSATPDEIMEVFSDRNTILIGKQFGIIIVEGPDNIYYDVATFRSNSNVYDSSDFKYTDMEGDALRRDFTINSLFYDSKTDNIIDFTGGQLDIKHNTIRSVGNPIERFTEDKARMLRAIRFMSKYGMGIEEQTFKAILAMAREITNVSHERICYEIDEILLSGNSHTGILMLHESDLLQYILPDLQKLIGVEQPINYHPEGDVWSHTLKVLEAFDANYKNPVLEETKFTWEHISENKIIALAWSCLLHDIGKPKTFTKTDKIRFKGHDSVGAELAGQILTSLKQPTIVIDTVIKLINSHMHFIDIKEMKNSKLRRLLRDEVFPLMLELHYCDCIGSNGDLSSWKYAYTKWREELDKGPEVKPLITGRDLIHMLGLEPSPIFGKILKEVYDAQLEGIVNTDKEALELAYAISKKG